MNSENRGEIVIFQKKGAGAVIQVTLKKETLWLSESQIALLFDRDRTVISKHIRNIFSEGELNRKSNVQKMHIAKSDKPVSFYNLDVIISVGYRLNSKRGTQFRIWASRVLKDHLVKGFTLNERRLKEKTAEIKLLKSSISLLERTVRSQAQDVDEARKLVTFLADFSAGLGVLDDYDHERLDTSGRTRSRAKRIGVEECLSLIDKMKSTIPSALFGRMKDRSFESSINQIFQSISGKELYPSIEEKAAMLLYLIVKNHSFIDGNKRIAAAVFLYFLDRNGLLYAKSGTMLLGNDGLAAMTLLIAESKSGEMETIRKVVVSILNRGLK
jgi:prophage maintenance system killer protein